MKLIIGLGNPGEKYKSNRHNVGYLVVDELKNLGTKKLKNIIVVKTNVFMNESGETVRKLVNQYKIKTSDLWIVHDDLDIPLGSYKIQKGKGPKLHNGVNSIERELGSEDFWRVRVGVDNREKIQNPNDKFQKIPGEEYALQDFDKKEIETRDRVIKKVIHELFSLITIY